MKEIIEKITSYNIFNFLVPGILFAIVCKTFIGYNLILENDFLGAFLYYFIGSIISRFGSLVIEPLLLKLKFIKFEDYRKYVEACKKDEKILTLLEVSNTYRTFLAMIIILLLVQLYHTFQIKWNISSNSTILILGISTLLMFLFGYRKQTKYISKRVIANS